MAKSSTHEIIGGIIKSLSQSSKSINEIAQDTGFDRIAISRYLEVLKESGILHEGDSEDSRKRVFSLQAPFVLRKDTYFGLPLDEKHSELIETLYALIRQEWIKKTKKAPVQIQVQKSLYKINKICNLNLPMGWYLYGALCVKFYDSSFDYAPKNLSQQITDCVVQVIDEYSKDKFGYETKLRQYEEEHNYFYLLKEEILRILYSANFSKNSLYVLNRKVKELFRLAPKNNDTKYQEILSEYTDLIVGLISSINEEQLKVLQPEITGSFEDIWKLIALFNYKNDLSGYYPKDILDKHFVIDIVQQEREIIERCSYLQSFLPDIEEPSDETYLKIKSLMSNIKTLTKEEAERKSTELEQLRKKSGDKAAQDKIAKEFGLE